MFTGIIEEIGTVRRIEHGAKGARLTIQANTVLEDTRIGDSIATNGVCLTVVSMTGDSFSAAVMAVWIVSKSRISPRRITSGL